MIEFKKKTFFIDFKVRIACFKSRPFNNISKQLENTGFNEIGVGTFSPICGPKFRLCDTIISCFENAAQ